MPARKGLDMLADPGLAHFGISAQLELPVADLTGFYHFYFHPRHKGELWYKNK